MRVRIDGTTDAVQFELGDAAVARQAEAVDGVALGYDAAGRIVRIEVRGVDPAALRTFTVDLEGVMEGPATAAGVPAPAWPRGPAVVAPSAPPYYEGPVGWDPEAEVAVAKVPFFQRGPVRLAAVALARKRGLDRVTAALLAEARGGR